VVISHGSGGTPLTHRDLALHLARRGFVVALAEHPGNNRTDNSLAGTETILESRPVQLRAVIDAVLASPRFTPHLRDETVAAIGHSLGGYTALALAGGHPTSLPDESPTGIARTVEVVTDARVRALVLLAPATPWFRQDDALAEVTAPILMYQGARDSITPPWNATIVEQGVADRSRVTLRVIEHAGHYSFFSVFPPEMVTPTFPPAQDPPGFDRATFLPQMFDDITAFLHHTL
jgi:predicted dienelactone hydrolase